MGLLRSASTSPCKYPAGGGFVPGLLPGQPKFPLLLYFPDIGVGQEPGKRTDRALARAPAGVALGEGLCFSGRAPSLCAEVSFPISICWERPFFIWDFGKLLLLSVNSAEQHGSPSRSWMWFLGNFPGPLVWGFQSTRMQAELT